MTLTAVRRAVATLIREQYLDLLRHVKDHGVRKDDRTGVGTLSVFGWQMRFDLAAGFPAVTTKKLHLKSVVHELLWFLKGETNVRYLSTTTSRSGTSGRTAEGDLGPIYGAQWRAWPGRDGAPIDQIKGVHRDAADAIPTRGASSSARGTSGDLGRDGARALPRALPDLGRRRPAVLPGLPAERRRLPRRAVQHRLVRAAHRR